MNPSSLFTERVSVVGVIEGTVVVVGRSVAGIEGVGVFISVGWRVAVDVTDVSRAAGFIISIVGAVSGTQPATKNGKTKMRAREVFCIIDIYQ
ncbi:MAG TPA: hypothetical protein DEH22_12400 [Chloroflexi bacterium]|nr:hypothetical protein [Chloroflexota bacterium]